MLESWCSWEGTAAVRKERERKREGTSRLGLWSPSSLGQDSGGWEDREGPKPLDWNAAEIQSLGEGLLLASAS